MLEKKTIVDQIEYKRNGVVQVRLIKVIIDGDRVIGTEQPEPYHRTLIEPGDSADVRLFAENLSLSGMGCAPVSDAEWARVKTIVDAVHTPDAIAAFTASKKADA